MTELPVLTIQVFTDEKGRAHVVCEAVVAGHPKWRLGYFADTPVKAVERLTNRIKDIADRTGKRGRYPRGYEVASRLV